MESRCTLRIKKSSLVPTFWPAAFGRCEGLSMNESRCPTRSGSQFVAEIKKLGSFPTEEVDPVRLFAFWMVCYLASVRAMAGEFDGM
jgi:hypothetical protein